MSRARLLQLRGVSFEWREPEKMGNLSGPQMGLVAQEAPSRVAAHLAAVGLPSRLADVPGLAVTRTVAMLVNEAVDAAAQGVASGDDIDAAMCKGVNYPIGPMAWGQQVGLPYVGTVLQHLARAYGEDRYRSSLWLQRVVHAAQVVGSAA